MTEVLMKKSSSPRSPRIRAHPLKTMKAQTMKLAGSKKSLSKKKFRSQYLYPTDDEDDFIPTQVDDPDEVGTYRSLDGGSVHSNYSMQRSMNQLMKTMVGEDIAKLQARLSRALEDSDLLRSRLRMELQEKQALEMKVTELTDKLVEAKKGLQETSLALHKVQMATNQLMSKRDQRELQLQSAIDQNHLYEKKISELEMHIAHMADINQAKSGAHSHSEKLINEQLEKIHQLEEEGGMLKGQIASLRRENMRLTDEKSDLEYMLETKKKRITLLEEHIKTSESNPALGGGGDYARINTANGNLRGSVGSVGSLDVDMDAIQKKISEMNSLEQKLDHLSGDKKFLEERLKQLESNLLNQQELFQKQLTQQQHFYQQQMQAQQQQLQQMQLQAFSPNVPFNGVSLPLDQIQQLASAQGNGNGGGPIIIRAVSRGSSDRPRSQQQRQLSDLGATTPNATQRKEVGETTNDNSQARGGGGEGGGREKRSRLRNSSGENLSTTSNTTEVSRTEPTATTTTTKQQQQQQPPPASNTTNNSNSNTPSVSSEAPRPRSNGPRPGIDTPNASTVTIPVKLGSSERQKTRIFSNPPTTSNSNTNNSDNNTTNNTSNKVTPSTPIATPVNPNSQTPVPIETVTYASLGNGASQKPPTSANTGEMPVPARSAAEINAMGGGSRQPSRQQEVLSRVGSATGADPEEVRRKLMDDRKEMKKQILIWNKKFLEENQREPTKAEREKNVGTFYRRYRQASRILKDMDGGSTKGGAKDDDDM